MTRDDAMRALVAWEESYDDRSVSDEARQWADNSASTVAIPENRGEYLAVLEWAFDSGRQYERLVAHPDNAGSRDG